jgi:uncharacterized protein (UPF0332 family)
MSREELAELIQRARRNLSAARTLLREGHNDIAVSRAYYAAFYAATAALLAVGVRRTRHSGVVAAFHERLVRGGEFTIEHHEALRRAFEDRHKGDYGTVFPTTADVERRIAECCTFVDAVAAFLSRKALLAPPTG